MWHMHIRSEMGRHAGLINGFIIRSMSHRSRKSYGLDVQRVI